MWILIFYFVLAYVLIMLPKYIRYSKSSYGEISGNGFFKTVLDKGCLGEFMTFSYLERLEGEYKLMTNAYLSKKDGRTTEIDLIMIHNTGIYVFESKNYSGWIFGDENNRTWTQVLHNKQKNKFFNPIMQNKGHINALSDVLDLHKENVYKSYIIFSERCTLKKLKVTSSNIKVIKREYLLKVIKEDISNSCVIFDKKDIDKIYVDLKKHTNVCEEIKKRHIEDIKRSASS